ncbi:hypothetical protein ACFO9Q_05330 [Paenibacillus sp. GCM10023252]
MMSRQEQPEGASKNSSGNQKKGREAEPGSKGYDKKLDGPNRPSV